MPFEIEINDEGILALSQRSLELAGVAIGFTAVALWGYIREEAPVDHGRLAGSFQLAQSGPLTWTINSGVEYALYVHEGTGVYGPTGRPIRPVNGTYLRFEIGGQVIYAREVQGQEPNPYVDRAMQRTEVRISEFVARALRESGP